MGFPVLKGKAVVLGITGSIAAYRAADLVRRLQNEGAEVHVILTRHACEFVTPLTFQSLSQNPVRVDLFGYHSEEVIGHIDIARKADVTVIAPATANILAKAAHGIADDYLSTVLIATTAPIIFCPAMNPAMYKNTVVQENIASLRKRGIVVVDPDVGAVACGEEGPGKFPSVERILHEVAFAVTEKSIKGKRILVSAGPTQEFFDPVRFISNPSSGKMGYAIARAALLRGAKVFLVSGPTHIEPPPGVNFYSVVSALEMREIITGIASNMDVVVMAAAVGDYRPETLALGKIKKSTDDVIFRMVPNPDILAEVGSRKSKGQILVGFAAETHDLIENARIKLEKKNLDMIVANDVTDPGSGFCVDTNRVKILLNSGEIIDVPRMSKDEVALRILDVVERLAEGS